MCTIKTLISAGDTPEILDACPSVLGFTFNSFCLASIDSEVNEL
jgi:hypothetical protein